LLGRYDRGLRFTRPVRRLPLVLVVVAAGGIILASGVGAVLGSAYATRYSMLALAPVLLVMAIGFGVLPSRWRAPAVGVVCVLGLVGSAGQPTQLRTQAQLVADRMHPAAGDVVAFCPDQLGPAVHRLAPNAGRQVVYPDFASPNMVNWVDYKKRIADSNPARFVRQLLAMAGPDHTIYLVYATDYQLVADRCQRVATRLAIARGVPEIRVNEKTTLIEHQTLAVFPPRR
jgi:mannosyltransferase